MTRIGGGIGHAPIDSREMFVSFRSFILDTGAAAVAAVSSSLASVWLLDDTSIEAASTSVLIPANWSTVAFDVYWCKATANNGNVRLRIDSNQSTPDTTDSLASGSTVTGTVATAAASATQYALVKTTLESGMVVTPGDLLAFRILRKADDGTDTLTGDIGVAGVTVRRLT